MRPTQSMYATQEEWQAALIKWMEEVPTVENQKQFMIFEDIDPTAHNFMFEGDLLDFSDCYFSPEEWDEVISFAEDFGYLIVLEDDERWDELRIMLDAAEDQEIPELDDDLDNVYDVGSRGNYDRMSEWDDN